jgi:hypothetical protein
MKFAWLKCTISKGMFSDELAISYPPAGAKPCASSVFVPRTMVRGEPGAQGKVRVTFFPEGQVTWAVLPADDQPLVQVSLEDLEEVSQS